MLTMYKQLIFALDVTGPILVILSLGWMFHRYKLIDEHFINVSNRFVFNVTLPCMLFLSTATRPLRQSLDVKLVLFGAGSTILIVFCLWLLAPWLVARDKRGIFVQGAFRSNMGIIGIALVLNTYGDNILPKVSVYLALLTILYNILSVMVLTTKKQSYLAILLKNPLIIGVILGLLVSWSQIPLPKVVLSTGEYFTQITLPLALTCIGGSLQWGSFRANHLDVIWTALFKLLFIPIAVTLAAISWGFKDQDLGLIYLMTAAPTATASFIMAREMTPYGDIAAEIIALTTAGSALTITAGLILLKSNAYI